MTMRIVMISESVSQTVAWALIPDYVQIPQYLEFVFTWLLC